MDFSHLVIVKRSPYYIHCVSEEDAISTGSQFKEDFVGVAVSDGRSLKVMVPKTTMTLTEKVTKEIPHLEQLTADLSVEQREAIEEVMDGKAPEQREVPRLR